MSRARPRGPFGVLLVDKPAGPTSHDVVGWARWALGIRDVGHCGTLDPAATGALVLCSGAATRLVPYLTAEDKTYEATFALGVGTDTLDAQGRCLQRAPVDAACMERALESVRRLEGTHMLPPPRYSAVKVKGVRAHEAARRGDDMVLEPRPMVVRSMADVRLREAVTGPHGDGPVIDVTVEVRKGTYIRSLAQLVGEQVGVPCHLAALHRVAAGGARVPSIRSEGGAGAAERPMVAAVAPAAHAVSTPPAADGRARPRWRLSLGLDRDSTGAELRSRMIDPWSLVSFPVLDVVGPDETAAFESLCHGRQVSLSGALGLALRNRRPEVEGLASGQWGEPPRSGAFGAASAREGTLDESPTAGLEAEAEAGSQEPMLLGFRPPQGSKGGTVGVVAEIRPGRGIRPVRVLMA